jgi:protease-4
VGAIQDTADDREISSLVLRLKDAELNRTQIEEIGAAMQKVRAGGKKVRLFCESYGPEEVVLGSFADEVLIQQGGEVSLPGMHMEEMYLADTLAWIGVKPDLVQVGPYKGANEQFMNAAPSKEWDQNINQLLDGLYATMRDEVKQGRKLSDERLDAAMKSAWMADAEEAKSAGLIDAAVDLPDLGRRISGKEEPEWAEIEVGEQPKHKFDSGNPFGAMTMLAELLSKKPPHTPTGPTIAVLHVDGVIVDGDSKEGGGLLGGEASVGSRTIRNALEEIRSEDQIRGVVVRVDSPGGSATASEVMWQGIRRLAEKKPVWVSVGGMAASGGYYVSVAGDRIYVNPSSIVGSIGVVGGKISLGELYGKVKVHVVERGRGPMSDLFDSDKPWNEQQLAMVRAKMTKTFDQFKDAWPRVARGSTCPRPRAGGSSQGNEPST